MVVILNGNEMELADGMSVEALLNARDIAVDTVVVELNKELVSSDRFGDTVLKDGDHLEVLRFVGGG